MRSRPDTPECNRRQRKAPVNTRCPSTGMGWAHHHRDTAAGSSSYSLCRNCYCCDPASPVLPLVGVQGPALPELSGTIICPPLVGRPLLLVPISACTTSPSADLLFCLFFPANPSNLTASLFWTAECSLPRADLSPSTSGNARPFLSTSCPQPSSRIALSSVSVAV